MGVFAELQMQQEDREFLEYARDSVPACYISEVDGWSFEESDDTYDSEIISE